MLRMTAEEFTARMEKMSKITRTHLMDDAATPEQTNAPMVEAPAPLKRRAIPPAVGKLLENLTLARLQPPVIELRFHPTRRWRFDVAWPAVKLACEVDGAIWTQGRHSRGKGMEADNEKINAAILLGWRVLRFSSDQAVGGYAIETIREGLG